MIILLEHENNSDKWTNNCTLQAGKPRARLVINLNHFTEAQFVWYFE